MARKGQKFKKYTAEFKEQVLKEYFSGEESPKSLELKYGVPLKTVEMWVYKVKAGGDISIDNRGKHSNKKGKPKTNNLTLEDYKERYEILKKYQAFLQARRGKK